MILKETFQEKSSIQSLPKVSRKTPVLEFLSNKVASLKAGSFIKNRVQHSCFLVNIAEFLITAFFIEHLW